MILNVNLVLSCLCFGTFDKAGFPAIAGKVASLRTKVMGGTLDFTNS